MNILRQTIRDNVYGNIFIPTFALELIDTPEFQRLRRIKQLGGIDFVYPGAKHTRFEHSIGVMHNLYTIKTKNLTHNFSKKKWKIILVAGLLHDIGHGPLSHSIEIIFNKICHEKIGKEIILNTNTTINKVLKKHKINPKDVIEMFDEKKNPIASQLLSSHVDADRMDYLLRDSYNTGTNYGLIDREKLIESMNFSGKQLTFKVSGIPAIESFLFARYQSFKAIYLHRIGLIYQEMFRVLFKRLKELSEENEYKPFINKLSPLLKKFNLEKYLLLDDTYFTSLVSELAATSDKVVKDLATRIKNRNLFVAWKYESKFQISKIKKSLIAKGLDPKYYLIKYKVEKSPYTLKKVKPIYVNEKNKKTPTNIIKLSSVIKTMSKQKYIEKYIFYPTI